VTRGQESHESRNGIDFELSRQPAPVHFDGLFAHPQFVRNLLVEQPGGHEITDLALALRETRESFLGFASTTLLLVHRERLDPGPLDHGQQLRFIDRLFQEIDRAFAHGARGRRHITLRAEENDRHRDALAAHGALHVEATQTRHPQVEQEACHTVVRRTIEKRCRRSEDLDADVVRSQHSLDRPENERVVVDGENSQFRFHALLLGVCQQFTRAPVSIVSPPHESSTNTYSWVRAGRLSYDPGFRSTHGGRARTVPRGGDLLPRVRFIAAMLLVVGVASPMAALPGRPGPVLALDGSGRAATPPGQPDSGADLPSAWEQYRGYIVAGVALLILEGLIIVSLVTRHSNRRALEERNAAMLAAAPDATFLLSKDGVCIDYCAPASNQPAATSASFAGRHLQDVLPPAVAASFTAALTKLTHEPGPIVFEYSLSMPDGQHQFEARLVSCGRTEVMAVARDITNQERSRHALNQRQADLSRLSRSTVLNAFASSIAHEIRQPLTGIMVNATTCLRWLGNSSPDLSEVRAAVSDIVEAGQRANEIVRRNRDLFKHHSTQMTALDLNTIVSEVEALVHSRLRAGQVRLINSVAADVPSVYGDRVELLEVLLNLISNSIDATEGVEANSRTIEILSSLAPDGSVKVSVRDTGVGLEGVDRERMFGLAYTTKPAASGVGLSICRSIVEAHGGRLWAEEDDVAGATFSFTLPVASSTAGAS
jgi:signal transduction histidine kinase